jgi:hypothetical protein
VQKKSIQGIIDDGQVLTIAKEHDLIVPHLRSFPQKHLFIDRLPVYSVNAMQQGHGIHKRPQLPMLRNHIQESLRQAVVDFRPHQRIG